MKYYTVQYYDPAADREDVIEITAYSMPQATAYANAYCRSHGYLLEGVELSAVAI